MNRVIKGFKYSTVNVRVNFPLCQGFSAFFSKCAGGHWHTAGREGQGGMWPDTEQLQRSGGKQAFPLPHSQQRGTAALAPALVLGGGGAGWWVIAPSLPAHSYPPPQGPPKYPQLTTPVYINDMSFPVFYLPLTET